jgi:hypothetical protein
MPKAITVAEIFKQVGLTPCGPKSWGTQIPERSAGVYVVALVPDSSVRLEGPVYAEYLDEREREHWLSEQPIIYIGQTTCLSRRLSQFYRHRYGQRSPHCGGEAVKLLQCSLWVYWSPASHPVESERMMISAFQQAVGRKPFANRP